MTHVTIAHVISTCLSRDRQKRNKVCKYMLKDNPLTSRELNRAAALIFFSKKCRVMTFLMECLTSVTRVTIAYFISTCLPRVRQKHNKVCKYMLKDNPL